MKDQEKKNEEENEIVPEDLDDSVLAEEHQGEQIKKLKGKLGEAEAKAKVIQQGLSLHKLM